MRETTTRRGEVVGDGTVLRGESGVWNRRWVGVGVGSGRGGMQGVEFGVGAGLRKGERGRQSTLIPGASAVVRYSVCKQTPARVFLER